MGQSDEYALWDAAYVLGSLSDVDRRKFEAHLRGCPSCRQSVDELSGMPALLGQLTVDEVTAIDDGGSDTPPPRVLTSLLATVSRRRHNARLATWAVAAAAAVVTVIGVLAGVQFHSGCTGFGTAAQPTRPRVAMTPVAPTELTATVAMTAQGWGTQIDMNCTYPAEAGTLLPTGTNPPPSWRWWWSAATAITNDWPLDGGQGRARNSRRQHVNADRPNRRSRNRLR